MRDAVCFLATKTDQYYLSLRRYCSSPQPCALNGYGYHSAEIVLDIVTEPGNLYLGGDSETEAAKYPSHLWPVFCACGYRFTSTDVKQVRYECLFRREDTGELISQKAKIPGMMWDAEMYHEFPAWCGPDGKAYHVVLPNGHTWHMDGEANNCTMPDDRVHKCWVRSGIAPNLTVTKGAPGESCSAGAGSIWSCKDSPDSWHGFLTNGVLKEC